MPIVNIQSGIHAIEFVDQKILLEKSKKPYIKINATMKDKIEKFFNKSDKNFRVNWKPAKIIFHGIGWDGSYIIQWEYLQ